jgi:hypothetical protein
MDENGNPVTNATVWVGGGGAANSCGFSANVWGFNDGSNYAATGNNSNTDSRWYFQGTPTTYTCDNYYHLYCIGQ